MDDGRTDDAWSARLELQQLPTPRRPPGQNQQAIACRGAAAARAGHAPIGWAGAHRAKQRSGDSRATTPVGNWSAGNWSAANRVRGAEHASLSTIASPFISLAGGRTAASGRDEHGRSDGHPP